MYTIAIYFSGHVRNLKDTIANFKRVFNCEGVIFDYYFTFWKVNHTQSGDSWKFNNKQNKQLVPLYDITEADVYAICPEAKRVKILESYSIPQEYAAYPDFRICQLYSLYQSFQDIPDNYDLYVRMRSDLYFFKGIDWKYILDKRHTHTLFLPSTVWYTQKNYPTSTLFNDFFWVSSYPIAKALASAYTTLLHIPAITPDTIVERIFQLYCDYLIRLQTPLTLLHCDFDVVLERRSRGFDANLVETRVYTTRRLQEGDFV